MTPFVLILVLACSGDDETPTDDTDDTDVGDTDDTDVGDTDTGEPGPTATQPVWLSTGAGPADFEETFAVSDAGDGTLVAAGFIGGLTEFSGPSGSPLPLLPTGGGGGDAFVVRIDAATGEPRSVFEIGGSAFDVAWDVSGTGDGGFLAVVGHEGDVTVGPSDDPLVVPGVGDLSAVVGSWDADDQRRFALSIVDVSGDFQMRVVATADGGALFCTQSHEGTVVAPGTAAEVVPANAGGEDILLGKLDGGGALQWVRTYGGVGDDYFGNPVETSDGYLLSGNFVGTVDFGGIQKTAVAPDGDAFVARFLWDGTGVWVTTVTSSSYVDSRRTALTDDGGVLVGGAFLDDVVFDGGTSFVDAGGADVFVARLGAADGSFEWAHHVSTGTTDWAEGVVALPGGGAAVLGIANYDGSSDQPADLFVDWSTDPVPVTFQSGFVARFDAAGAPVALDAFDFASVRAGFATSDGDLVVAGSFRTGVVFGQGTANEQAPSSQLGLWDPYVLRLGH